MKRNTIVVPLQGSPMCGHSFPHGQMMGREEGGMIFKGKFANYMFSVEYSGCELCNKAQDKRIEEISGILDDIALSYRLTAKQLSNAIPLLFAWNSRPE